MSEREELQAALDARRELGREYEPQIIDAFLERIEKRLEERTARPVVRHEREHHAITPLVLGSLGLAIPLMGIAGAAAGLGGVALVCLAIVLVNFFVARR